MEPAFSLSIADTIAPNVRGIMNAFPGKSGLMRLCRSAGLALLGLCVTMFSYAGKPKACVSAEEAAALLNQDVCITAHVYDVVRAADGTQFLDVCSPETPDERCQLTIVSLRQDRDTVGDLTKYRNTNVRLRGTVQSMRGRSGILLSHDRQFAMGPPRFRPNPRLAHGFSGEDDRPPIADPNLRTHGGGRGFMNTKEQRSTNGK